MTDLLRQFDDPTRQREQDHSRPYIEEGMHHTDLSLCDISEANLRIHEFIIDNRSRAE